MVSGGTSKPPVSGGATEAAKRRRTSNPGGVVPVSCNGNECLKLHVVLAAQDLEADDGDEYTCDPEFAERIFGEDGKIYGYRGLKIDLWLHAATFHAYVQIQYTSKSSGGKKTPCTDVLAKLKEVFGDGLTEDRNSFQQSLLAYSSDFQQLLEKNGEVVFSWRSEAGASRPVKERNANADSSIETADKLKEENTNADSNMEQITNADSNSETPGKLEEENTNADSNMEHITNADSNSETPGRLEEENTNAHSLSETPGKLEEENTNADSNNEILDKLKEENTNADGNSVTLEKTREENANADSNMEENTNADGNSVPLEKVREENTNADGSSVTQEKVREENTNADSNTELLDKQTEENTHADSNSETLEKLGEGNTHTVSNSELPEKQKEENTNADSNSDAPEKLNEVNPTADNNSESQEKLKQIVRVELGDPAVRAWHARLTPLSLLFIEGAQPIESDDPLWEVYLALERDGLQTRVAGFCNVYRFYHYPDSTRLRISQILVLPPYQGDGFGLQLLQAVNTAATTRSCFDVTMEDPSVVLRKLRDTMDVLRLLSRPSVDEALKDALGKLELKKELTLSSNGSEVAGDQSVALVNFNGSATDAPSQRSRRGVKEKSLLAPPAHLVEEIRKEFKISKMQFRRCWEQLLFLFLDPKDRDLQDVFREALVQRLNLEIFEKDSGKKSVGKRVIDTDNEYDNSKTFIMMKKRKFDAIDGNGSTGDEESGVAGDEVEALVPGPEEKAKVLQEELKEREDELLGVAQAVARHCTTLGLNFPSMKIWETVAQETKEEAT